MIKNGSFPISIENLGPYEFLIFTVENIFDVTINNNFSMTNGWRTLIYLIAKNSLIEGLKSMIEKNIICKRYTLLTKYTSSDLPKIHIDISWFK